MNTKDYINQNKERFLNELLELLKIESVSADPKFKNEVDKVKKDFNELEDSIKR